MSVRVAVFASGGGTTLQALLDHVSAASDPTWRVGLVVSDKPGVGALGRAQVAGVPSAVVFDRDREPSDVAAETLRVLERHEIDAVCLAGYLRLVPEEVVTAFEGRMLNVHPALLPAFGGKGMYGDRVHRAVLESGARLSGPTVHLVDAEYDRGPPLAQWPVPVMAADTLETLRTRVQAVERALYPVVVDRVAAAVRTGRRPTPLIVAGSAFQAAQRSTEGSDMDDAAMKDIIERAFGEEHERPGDNGAEA